MSEKDGLNLSNRRFLLAIFTHKKHPRGASIHEIKESFPLKPSLVATVPTFYLDRLGIHYFDAYRSFTLGSKTNFAKCPN